MAHLHSWDWLLNGMGLRLGPSRREGEVGGAVSGRGGEEVGVISVVC